MGFKENLKAELSYTGMLVKELSALSGIKKHTLDNYLNTHCAMPPADSAVKIAKVLGVSVEYLVTGENSVPGAAKVSPDVEALMAAALQLSKAHRKIVLTIAQALQNSEQRQTPA